MERHVVSRTSAMSPRTVARAQGAFNVAAGLWPLLSTRSFEWVYGPKADRWLEHTVAGLLVTVGVAQLGTRDARDVRTARVLGVGTAATLLTIDLVYVARGRIRPTYLQDAVCEAGWLAAWARVGTRAV